jgi:hypothetical protein
VVRQRCSEPYCEPESEPIREMRDGTIGFPNLMDNGGVTQERREELGHAGCYESYDESGERSHRDCERYSTSKEGPKKAVAEAYPEQGCCDERADQPANDAAGRWGSVEGCYFGIRTAMTMPMMARKMLRMVMRAMSWLTRYM